MCHYASENILLPSSGLKWCYSWWVSYNLNWATRGSCMHRYWYLGYYSSKYTFSLVLARRLLCSLSSERRKCLQQSKTLLQLIHFCCQSVGIQARACSVIKTSCADINSHNMTNTHCLTAPVEHDHDVILKQHLYYIPSTTSPPLTFIFPHKTCFAFVWIIV